MSLLANQRIYKRISPLTRKPKPLSFKFGQGQMRRRHFHPKFWTLPKKAGKYPFFIGAGVLVLFIFLTSSYMFPLSRNGLSKSILSLPEESHLKDFPGQYDFVQSLPDERASKLVSLRKEDNRENELPQTYRIEKGDSITSISKKYAISIYDLIRANKITDPRRLRVSDTIIIPSRGAGFAGEGIQPRGFTESMAVLPDDISIMASARSGNAPLVTQFFITTKLNSGSLQYLWDLGNDRYSFERDPKSTYTKPGLYNVFVIVSDSSRTEVVSNKVSVEVKTREMKRLHIDSMLSRFLTIGQVNDLIELGNIVQGSGENETTLVQHPEIFKDAGNGKFVSVKPGYSELTVSTKKMSYKAHVFVSPFPSKHSFEPDYDWYKTQFATGINGNCGPASAAMAIYWAKGVDIPVAKVRQEIGLPYQNGAVDFCHMDKSFRKHGVEPKHVTIQGMEDIMRIVDKGDIAIVVLNTRSLMKTRGSSTANFVGRYYEDITGHYIVIKGYSLDGKYVVAYDPMPSDWVANETRYADGTTMLGKNRYYPVSQLFASMGREAYEISR